MAEKTVRITFPNEEIFSTVVGLLAYQETPVDGESTQDTAIRRLRRLVREDNRAAIMKQIWASAQTTVNASVEQADNAFDTPANYVEITVE